MSDRLALLALLKLIDQLPARERQKILKQLEPEEPKKENIVNVIATPLDWLNAGMRKFFSFFEGDGYVRYR